jgi:hypothetical protein
MAPHGTSFATLLDRGLMIQDVRIAFRSLAKARGFIAAALLTLGLGIGATPSSSAWSTPSCSALPFGDATDRIVSSHTIPVGRLLRRSERRRSGERSSRRRGRLPRPGLHAVRRRGDPDPRRFRHSQSLRPPGSGADSGTELPGSRGRPSRLRVGRDLELWALAEPIRRRPRHCGKDRLANERELEVIGSCRLGFDFQSTTCGS